MINNDKTWVNGELISLPCLCCAKLAWYHEYCNKHRKKVDVYNERCEDFVEYKVGYDELGNKLTN